MGKATPPCEISLNSVACILLTFTRGRAGKDNNNKRGRKAHGNVTFCSGGDYSLTSVNVITSKQKHGYQYRNKERARSTAVIGQRERETHSPMSMLNVYQYASVQPASQQFGILIRGKAAKWIRRKCRLIGRRSSEPVAARYMCAEQLGAEIKKYLFCLLTIRRLTGLTAILFLSGSP